MSISGLKSLYKEDVDYYFKTYKAIFAKLDPSSLPALQEQWDKDWSEILKNLTDNEDKNCEIRMLTIGSGEGYRDCMVIKHIVQSHPNVYVSVIEPIMDQVKLFQQKAGEISEEHPGVKFDWHVKTFEQYLKEHHTPERFHLVVAFHSLYYMDEWKMALDNMYSMVEPNGILTVTVSSDKSQFGRFNKKYRQMEGSDMHLQLSDEVCSHLMTKAVEIDKYQRVSLFDITEVFDEYSENGNMQLDFLLQRWRFRETAPNPFQDEVLTLLKDNTTEKDGVHWFRGDEADVVVKLL